MISRGSKIKSTGNVKYKFWMDLISEKNENWMNSYIPSIMLFWRANFNILLVIDIGNILDYMWEYATNHEWSLTRQVNCLIQSIMVQSLVSGQEVTMALKINGKAYWWAGNIPPGFFHLVLGIPMVQCSHTFVKINIEKRSLHFYLDKQNYKQIFNEQNKTTLRVMLVMLLILRALQISQELRKIVNISKWQKGSFWIHINMD